MRLVHSINNLKSYFWLVCICFLLLFTTNANADQNWIAPVVDLEQALTEYHLVSSQTTNTSRTLTIPGSGEKIDYIENTTEMSFGLPDGCTNIAGSSCDKMVFTYFTEQLEWNEQGYYDATADAYQNSTDYKNITDQFEGAQFAYMYDSSGYWEVELYLGIKGTYQVYLIEFHEFSSGDRMNQSLVLEFMQTAFNYAKSNLPELGLYTVSSDNEEEVSFSFEASIAPLLPIVTLPMLVIYQTRNRHKN